jgi:hypothetical protein
MARIIDEFPAEWRMRRYPWQEWLDGQPRILTQGVDFTISLVAMQRHFVRTAKERGLRGYTRVTSPTEIAVQAVAPDGHEDADLAPSPGYLASTAAAGEAATGRPAGPAGQPECAGSGPGLDTGAPARW